MQTRIKKCYVYLNQGFPLPSLHQPTSSHLFTQLSVIIFKLVNKLYLFICKPSLACTGLFCNIS